MGDEKERETGTKGSLQECSKRVLQQENITHFPVSIYLGVHFLPVLWKAEYLPPFFIICRVTFSASVWRPSCNSAKCSL